jgi:hypothetical protein
MFADPSEATDMFSGSCESYERVTIDDNTKKPHSSTCRVSTCRTTMLLSVHSRDKGFNGSL